LIALDAATGMPIPTFGHDGIVDLKKGLDADVDSVESVIGATSPPMIVGNVAVIGAALEVGFYPPSRRNVPGHVRGFDVRTGERRWIFHTIPRPGEFGNDTWLDSSWAYTGNAAVWAPMSADPELGYVYLPVEAPTSDFTGGHRPGNNLFSTSLVCLDAATGERVWHFQLVHHDIWDFDLPAAPILLDVTVDGRPIKAVAQVTKQNFTYVFDRVTGEPVWPIEERSVPQTDVPGEWTAPTQPFPTKPAPFDRQGFTEDDLIDFTPELFAAALEIARRYRWGELFSPGSLRDDPDGTIGTLRFPTATGGANWEGAAVDVETGILYVGSVSSPGVIAIGRPDPDRSDLDYTLAGGTRVRGPNRLPLTNPPYGRITAIDLNTGEHLWMMPNGDGRRHLTDRSALEGVDLPPVGHPTRAVMLVTRTLFLAGEGFGADPILHILDKSTGEPIADILLPAAATGSPMTYMYGGKQYVVVPVGARGKPAELVALTLP
jgi:quinoprotein glucose dehydrogenase